MGCDLIICQLSIYGARQGTGSTCDNRRLNVWREVCAVLDVRTSSTTVITCTAAQNESASALAVGIGLAQELSSESSIGSGMVLYISSAPYAVAAAVAVGTWRRWIMMSKTRISRAGI